MPQGHPLQIVACLFDQHNEAFFKAFRWMDGVGFPRLHLRVARAVAP